jgi:hypothetical protein
MRSISGERTWINLGHSMQGASYRLDQIDPPAQRYVRSDFVTADDKG